MTRFVLGAGRDSLIVSKEKLVAYENLREIAQMLAAGYFGPRLPELELAEALAVLDRLDGKQP